MQKKLGSLRKGRGDCKRELFNPAVRTSTRIRFGDILALPSIQSIEGADEVGRDDGGLVQLPPVGSSIVCRMSRRGGTSTKDNHQRLHLVDIWIPGCGLNTGLVLHIDRKN